MSGSTSSPNDALVEPPGAVVAGKSLAEWGAAWWQWALAIPKAQNPILGGPCDQNQPGDVFFLAGNTGGKTARTCSVPAGKPLFFPILNTECGVCPEKSCGLDLQAAEVCAESYFDAKEPSLLLVEIDGTSLTGLADYRVYDGTFEDPQPADPSLDVFPKCGGPIKDNACGTPAGSPRTAAASGYWIMTHPLSSGDHTVRFAGAAGGFSLDVTYQLTVTP